MRNRQLGISKMKVSDILAIFPAAIDWMVLFDLETVQQIAETNTILAMYHLPNSLDISPYSHVVLSNIGRFLASNEQAVLLDPVSGKVLPTASVEQSLLRRFSEQLNLFSVDEANCLGLGQVADYEPVLLHITVQDVFGQAQALFERPPTTLHYELLQAVGVKFLGGELRGSHYLARFQNRLPAHIHAGILSHFSRTAHCNLFFLQHGTIDRPLEIGLLQASQGRLLWGQKRTLTTLEALAQKICQQIMPMLCQPPSPARPFGYGDLVPMGFVLRGLKAGLTFLQSHSGLPSLSSEVLTLHTSIEKLQTYLGEQRQNQLWAFHRGRLVTATDSALVLQGMEEADIVAALAPLQSFAADEGGYYPQLWATEASPERMILDESCRHWCQPDYATTCLIYALRRRVGQSADDLCGYLRQGMNNRSGLFFANPYLVDWLLAQGLQHDPGAEDMRQQLRSEIVASMNTDYTFGRYDVLFSTALAIVTLVTLGDRTRTVLAAQLRLLDLIEQNEPWPIATPFYSSLRVDRETPIEALVQQTLISGLTPNTIQGQPKQHQLRQISIQGETQYHSISLYLDIYQVISTAIVVLALSESCLDNLDQQLGHKMPQLGGHVHPRYQCRNHCDYIAQFALPPYLRSEALVPA